jgi:nicotinate phosphoribosyltransferase
MTGAPPTTSALVVDLYELTMMQAYHLGGVDGRATFDLFVRRLPEGRDFLLVAGLATVLDHLEAIRFTAADLEYLASLGQFRDEFLGRLERLRFSGDVAAMPEGTVAFAGEPILRVTAPIIEAQLLETVIMNLIHLQTLIASKAARVVLAADGRGLVDFGLRRTHGTESGLYGARASHIAGFSSTSNVAAGERFGIPVTGTMAHSYVQALGDEAAAFRSFVEAYPETVLLVDTYDTLRGVDRVIRARQRIQGAGHPARLGRSHAAGRRGSSSARRSRAREGPDIRVGQPRRARCRGAGEDRGTDRWLRHRHPARHFAGRAQSRHRLQARPAR